MIGTEFSEQIQPLVTVTSGRVTKDLSIAYIYVSILESTPEQRKASFRHLEGLTQKIRSALAGRIRHQLRTVPELRFFLDESQFEASKMEDLFAKIRAERARRGVEDDE